MKSGLAALLRGESSLAVGPLCLWGAGRRMTIAVCSGLPQRAEEMSEPALSESKGQQMSPMAFGVCRGK